MSHTILVGDIRTGRSLTTIPFSAMQWSVAHRGAGDISAEIPMYAPEIRQLVRDVDGVWRPSGGLRPGFLRSIDPARTFIALLEGDHVIAAGPIWVHDYSWETDILKVKAAGNISSVFDHRYVMGVVSSAYAAWGVTYSSLSLGSIAKRLIQLMVSHTGGDLPIVLPADESGTRTRTYRGFEMATVQSRLEQLMGVDNGPDIRFDPQLTTDRLGIEWVMRVGTEAQPMLFQAGADHVWDFRVPRGGVGGLSVYRDASRIGGRSWATGSGSDEALLISRADNSTLISDGFPLLEVEQARSTVEVQATLDDWAAGNLAAAARPMMTVTATVRADIPPALGDYRVGDFARLWPPVNHSYLSALWPEGYARVRIVGISGNLGKDVTLTFAPVMEGR